jgi:hypothetical protein
VVDQAERAVVLPTTHTDLILEERVLGAHLEGWSHALVLRDDATAPPQHDGLKLNRFAAARSIDGIMVRTRRIPDAGLKNYENNPMQSRNWASHHPKTQDLVLTM